MVAIYSAAFARPDHTAAVVETDVGRLFLTPDSELWSRMLVQVVVAPYGCGPSLPDYAVHYDVRAQVIQLQRRAITHNPIAIIGDSIVEIAPWREIAGRPALNCGFAGIRVRQLGLYIDKFISAISPAAAVVAVGVNNAQVACPPDEFTSFVRDYSDLVERLGEHTRLIVLATILPIETGRDISTVFDSARVSILNDAITRVGHESGLTVVDAGSVLRRPDGTARVGTTVDGVHLTAASYEIVQSVLARELERALCMTADRRR